MPMPSYLVAIVAGCIESRTLGDRTRVWAEPSVIEKAAYEFAEVRLGVTVLALVYVIIHKLLTICVCHQPPLLVKHVV